VAWAALLLGSLFLARIHGGGRQATVLLALLTLTIPGGLLAGLAVAVRKEAGRRLDVGQGRRGGSLVKIATVLAIGGGVIFALLAFQLATWPMARIFPDPQSGALYFYRAGLGLPAVAVLAVLSAGLGVVDRPRALVPGLLVAVVAALWIASAWLHRGAGDVGFELAGMGLAVPVAMLLAAGTTGGLLLSNARGREELAIHRARPFDMGDLGPLLRGALGPSLRLAGLALAATTLTVVMLRGETRGEVAALAAVFLATGGALALVLDGCEGHGTPTALVLTALLALGGLLLMAWPGPLTLALVPGLRYGEPSLVALRITGALLIHEVVVFQLTRMGWLHRRHPTWLEIAATALPVALAVVALVLWDRHGAVPVMLCILVCRAALIPFLRR